METIPLTGVPRVLDDGETWEKAPKVTLQINGETGVVVEEGRGEVITTSFTPSSEADERAVLDETSLV